MSGRCEKAGRRCEMSRWCVWRAGVRCPGGVRWQVGVDKCGIA